MPQAITQCYLPPGRADIPALTPAEAGTRLSVQDARPLLVCDALSVAASQASSLLLVANASSLCAAAAIARQSERYFQRFKCSVDFTLFLFYRHVHVCWLPNSFKVRFVKFRLSRKVKIASNADLLGTG